MSEPQLPKGQDEVGKGVMSPELQLFFKNYLPVAKDVVMHTDQFFEEMPEEFTLKDAAIFASVGLGIQGIMGQLMQFSHGLNVIKEIPVNVVFTFAMAGFYSGIFYGLAKAQGGKGSFEDTAKVVCYGTLVGFVSWIPIIGILPSLYGGYLIAVGIKKIHELEMLKAAVTVFLPLFMIGGAIMLFQFLSLIKH